MNERAFHCKNGALKAINLKELADLIEVVYGLAEYLGYSEQELNILRSKKRDKRRGFSRGIVLINAPE